MVPELQIGHKGATFHHCRAFSRRHVLSHRADGSNSSTLDDLTSVLLTGGCIQLIQTANKDNLGTFLQAQRVCDWETAITCGPVERSLSSISLIVWNDPDLPLNYGSQAFLSQRSDRNLRCYCLTAALRRLLTLKYS